MQPGRILPQETLLDLRRRWLQEGSPPPELDPIVAASWRRCQGHLNPNLPFQPHRLSPAHLRAVQEQNRNLLILARPVMEDVHQFVEGTGTVVLLLDASGCVLDVFGDPEMVEAGQALGLAPGVFWGEGQMGTNAFALALLSSLPVWVVGAEHIFRELHDLAAAGAPFYSPAGRPLGVLGLATHRRRAHPYMLAIASAAARCIETRLQVEGLSHEVNLRLAELRGVLEAISEGILSWNGAGVLIHMNRRAGEILGIRPEMAAGRPVEEFLRWPAEVRLAVELGRSLQDAEVTLEVEGRPVECLLNLQPLSGPDGPNGYLATLRPLAQVRRWVTRMIDDPVSLSWANFPGRSRAMQTVRQLARAASRLTVPVLLTGEAGVGKSVLARLIHAESARSEGPFLSIPCAAIPRNLILGELFGVEGERPGKFELAHGGTIYLDEVDALPLEAQTLLWRFLETGEVLRQGGSRPQPVDVRVIASTRANLTARVAEGSFRADLFYLLSAFVIAIPPLRERPEDLTATVEEILRTLSTSDGPSLRLTDEAWSVLRRYPWPGNVRELENVLERAAVLAEDGLIDAVHLPDRVRLGEPTWVEGDRPLSLAEAERWAILRAAAACRGRVQEMAQLLGIGRTTLWRKLRTYGIDPREFREPFRNETSTLR